MYNARLNTDSRRRPLNRVCPIFPSLWIAPVFTLPVGTDSPALSHMVYRHTVDLSSLGCSVPLGRKHRSDLSPVGQPQVELIPESETKFFVREVDAQVTFVKDEKGQVTHLILNWDADREGKKIK